MGVVMQLIDLPVLCLLQNSVFFNFFRICCSVFSSLQRYVLNDQYIEELFSVSL